MFERMIECDHCKKNVESYGSCALVDGVNLYQFCHVCGNEIFEILDKLRTKEIKKFICEKKVNK